jgi:hypothetical protein
MAVTTTELLVLAAVAVFIFYHRQMRSDVVSIVGLSTLSQLPETIEHKFRKGRTMKEDRDFFRKRH